MEDSRAAWVSRVVELFTDLARQLALEPDRDGVFARVVDAALSQIDGAEYAGITVVCGATASTAAASSAQVRAVDQLQYATGEGPSLSAGIDRERVVCVDDLRSDPRWPLFTAAVADLDVRSMLSFQLYTGAGRRADTIGSLTVYARTPAAFTGESIQIGTLLAALASGASAAAAKTDNLRLALTSRDCIGQAKGILMERFKLTPDEAFDLLVASSQQTHLKLREIAERLTVSGHLIAD